MNKLQLVYSIPTPRSIFSMLKTELKDCDTVLDFGCGSESLLITLGLNHRDITGADIWKPYVLKNEKDKRYKAYYHLDITKAEFPDKSFDAVILTDVIEHIAKTKMIAVLSKVCQWAKEKVVIMTPDGFMGNEIIDNNPYQAHVSGWSKKELEDMGMRVHCVWRIKRKRYGWFTGLEIFRTLFAVKDCREA